MKPLLLLLAACSTTATVVPDLPGPILLEVVEVWEECSGAGGAHILFAPLDAPSRGPIVHHGGHAAYFDPPFTVGELAGSVEQVEDITVPEAGWCIGEMSVVPWHSGTVTRFADEAEARDWFADQ